jgi:hypothetical protein
MINWQRYTAMFKRLELPPTDLTGQHILISGGNDGKNRYNTHHSKILIKSYRYWSRSSNPPSSHKCSNYHSISKRTKI